MQSAANRVDNPHMGTLLEHRGGRARQAALPAWLLLCVLIGCESESDRAVEPARSDGQQTDIEKAPARQTRTTPGASRNTGSPPDQPSRPVAGSPTQDAPAPGAEPAKTKQVRDPRYDVVITYVGHQKIRAIKAVREVTGLGLKAAKELVDSAPSVVDTELTRSAAEAVAKRLNRAGLRVSLRKSEVADPSGRDPNHARSAESISKLSRAEVTKRVTDIVCRRLRAPRDRVTPNTTFDKLGTDELDAIELVMDFEDEFKISIPDMDAERFGSVGNVIDYVLEKK